MWEDFYLGRGNDNPPMTVRMDRQEQTVNQILFYAKWIMGILAALLVTGLANLLKH